MKSDFVNKVSEKSHLNRDDFPFLKCYSMKRSNQKDGKPFSFDEVKQFLRTEYMFLFQHFKV